MKAMKKFLNPKRRKIIFAIVAILAFGIALDFIKPIPKGESEFDYEYYANQLGIISSAIDKYYEINGAFPDMLFGGDKDGWRIAGRYQDDPLIASGILESYPIRKIESNRFKRLCLYYQWQNPSYGTDGKSSNKMINSKYGVVPHAKAMADKNDGCNPLVGNFYYELLKSEKNGYIIGIVEPLYAQSFSSTCEFTGSYYELHYVDENGKIEIIKGNGH